MTQSQASAPEPDYLLPLADVKKMTTLGRTTVYRRMAEGTFPQAVKLSPARVAWWMSDIRAWMDALPQAGRPSLG